MLKAVNYRQVILPQLSSASLRASMEPKATSRKRVILARLMLILCLFVCLGSYSRKALNVVEEGFLSSLSKVESSQL